MKRYITQPVKKKPSLNNEYYDEPLLPQLTVHEDRDPKPTGLLDSKGNELFAISETKPIGYLRK